MFDTFCAYLYKMIHLIDKYLYQKTIRRECTSFPSDLLFGKELFVIGGAKINTSNPQPIGFSGILLAKRQNSFYCTYFLHNRNVADTKFPYPIKRLEVIRWFNQKSMVFNQSLS